MPPHRAHLLDVHAPGGRGGRAPTRGRRSHSGVKKVMPLMTSSDDVGVGSDSAAPDGPTRAREDGAPPAHVVQRQLGAEPLDRLGARVVAGDHGDPVAPGDPARDLAEEVRAGPAALGVQSSRGPSGRGCATSAPLRGKVSPWTRLVFCGDDASATHRRARRRAVARPSRRRAGPGRGRQPVPGPLRGGGLRLWLWLRLRLRLRLRRQGAAPTGTTGNGSLSNSSSSGEQLASQQSTSSGELARTGADPGLIALLGAGLIVTGAGLRVRVRRPIA